MLVNLQISVDMLVLVLLLGAAKAERLTIQAGGTKVVVGVVVVVVGSSSSNSSGCTANLGWRGDPQR